MTLRAPRTSKEAKDSLALLEAACNLVDALELGHAKLTNTTLLKLKNTRAALDKELNEEATKWDREDAEEARQAAKRKAEQEKFDKLSPAEQEKVSRPSDRLWLSCAHASLLSRSASRWRRKGSRERRRERRQRLAERVQLRKM